MEIQRKCIYKSNNLVMYNYTLSPPITDSYHCILQFDLEKNISRNADILNDRSKRK